MDKITPVLKTDLEENWDKAKNFIPKKNEIIVYETSSGEMKLKIGNGKLTVGELPFLMERTPGVSEAVLTL